MSEGLTRFNQLSRAGARDLLETCAAVPRWAEEVERRRPYDDVEQVLTVARIAAEPWDEAEIDAALARHPRIGERTHGQQAEAAHSRREQSGVDTSDTTVAQQLRAGNHAYEERFGHVFLIRAAGRSAEEILQSLQERLGNDPGTERRIAAEQLREIAVLRLEQELQMTSHITTHVLDAVRGTPAVGLGLTLARHDAEGSTQIATGVTDSDGRARDLGPPALEPGTYRLIFATGEYFAAQQRPAFYPQVTIDFVVEDSQQHYHVPILLSPYAYSTYRGS